MVAIQIVMGPAGSGKSTYCSVIQDHCESLRHANSAIHRRSVHVGNLDPAAEHFVYEPTFDIRDLISVEEVMEELQLGPNGALIYCMEYLLQNMDWLVNELESFAEDDYLLLDCPGQIELYTHVPIMKTIIQQIQTCVTAGAYTKLVSVFCIDTTFCCDTSKFISGSLLALSSMIALELPHVNVLTKCDLLPEKDIETILNFTSAQQLWDTDQYQQTKFNLVLRNTKSPNISSSTSAAASTSESEPTIDSNASSNENNSSKDKKNSETYTAQRHPKQQDQDQEPPPILLEEQQQELDAKQKQQEVLLLEERRRQRHRLTEVICSVLDDFTMVSYVPFNITDEESIDHVLNVVDHTIQYGEDLEVTGAYDINDGDDNNDTIHNENQH